MRPLLGKIGRQVTVTDKPIQKKPARPRAKAKVAASRQVDLPLAAPANPVPPPAPAPPVALPPPVAPTPPPALADRAARYNRHRSPLDDRPLAEQAAQAPTPPRPLATARPYLPPRGPEPREELAKPDQRPKALDMAAIAARNRHARDAARDERPVAAPVPRPTARPRTERPEPIQPPVQRPRDDSMLARAARHNTLLRDEQERAAVQAQKPHEAKAPAPQRQKPVPDDQSMVNRAADATKRRRNALGGPVAAETPEEMAAPPIHLTTTAFVLVSRNDGGRVVGRLAAWKSLVEAPDVRWWLLDLGSVDESIAHAEEQHVQVVAVAGGAVEPMRTLERLLRRVDADTVLIADADALPDKRALKVIAEVRAGKRVAAAPAENPGILAIDRTAWVRDGFGAAADLSAWGKKPLPGVKPLLHATGNLVPRLLHAPKIDAVLMRARPLLLRLRKMLRR